MLGGGEGGTGDRRAVIGSFVARGERFLGGEWVLLPLLEVRDRYV